MSRDVQNLLMYIGLMIVVYHALKHPTVRNVTQALMLGIRDGLV